MKARLLFVLLVILAPVYSAKANTFLDTLDYNYFSPNNDSINDYYVIENVEKYREHKFSVFNRWGELVFQASPYSNNPHDGQDKTFVGLCNQPLCIFGKELPEGVYFYRLEYKFEDKPAYIDGKLILKR
jgi:gliding motility-associated-like protein